MKKLSLAAAALAATTLVACKPEFQSGQFTPNEDKTLFFIGQDIDTVNTYAYDVGSQFAGVTAYIAPDGTGVYSRFNDANGPLDLQSYLAGYPDKALSIGLWMVGKEELIAAEDADTLDTYFNVLNEIKSANRPVFLRLGYEVDGYWNHYEPEDFVTMWRLTHDWLEQNEADNVTLVWQLAGYCRTDADGAPSQFSGIGGNTYLFEDYDAWWPGDEYVDWTGLSYFAQLRNCMQPADNLNHLGGLPMEFGTLTDVNDENESLALENIMAYLESKDKPIMVAESAPKFYSTSTLEYLPWTDTSSADLLETVTAKDIWDQWYEGYFEFLEEHRHSIRAVAYINAHWNSMSGWACLPGSCVQGYWGDSRVQAQDAILQKWNETLDSTWLLTQYENGFSDLTGWDDVNSQPLGQAPYTFEHKPHAIPGVIEAELFDVGGEGVAYHDTTSGNAGAEYGTQCRTNESVDVGPVGSAGCSVGWTAATEYLEYTIEQASDAAIDFNVKLTFAHPDDGGLVSLYLNDALLVGDIPVPNTGAWDVFETVSVDGVSVEPGVHVLKVVMETEGASSASTGTLDSIEFNDPNASSPYFETYSLTIPGIVEFEQYNRGKEGSAFEDLTVPDPANIGIQDSCSRADVDPADYATHPIKIAEHYGTCAVMATTVGEWIEYSVTVLEDGVYDLAINAVHGGTRDAANSPEYRLTLDSIDITGTQIVPWTADWNWGTNVISGINLAAGEYRLRFEVLGNSDNHAGLFNSMVFSRTSSNDVGQSAYQPNSFNTVAQTTLEVGHFDLGGNGVAYYDDPATWHADWNPVSCRSAGNETEVLEENINGYCGTTGNFAGEWFEYSITVDADALYELEIGYANGTDPAIVQLELNGTPITQPIALPFTDGSWGYGTYTHSQPIQLAAGAHILRLQLIQDFANYQYLKFTPIP